VIFPKSRLIKSATFVLVLLSAQFSFSQSSTPAPASAAQLDLTVTLPDAPSFSTSNPQTPAQTQTPAPAQQQPPPNETPEQRKAREQREEADREVKEEEKQRFGGVIPQFNVVTNGQGVPLTPKQKFDISLHTIIDPYTIGLAFIVGGGFGEIGDTHTGYGHGTSGLFKRIGASYADNVNGNIIGNALLPVILRQDPRYFRKGVGSIKSRIFYSAMTTFICKGDNGKTQFNTSNVLGNFISGAISNAYYPSDERGVALTLENGVTVTAEGMVGAQLLEFAPDVTALIHRHREHHRMMKQQQADAAAAAKRAAEPPVVVQPAAPPPTTPPQQ
jgi:hypothetical protein